MTLLRRMVAGAIVARSNLTPFERPDRLPRAMLAMAPWGASVAGAMAAAAGRYPDRVGLHDDDGPITYAAMWSRARRTAQGLSAAGIGPGTRVGLMCRNHRGFVEWLAAASAVGADVVFLNTGFAAPQLADVVADEGIDHIIHDDEFTPLVARCGAITHDEAAMCGFAATVGRLAPQRHQGRMVILTSGTTGRPKGATRRSDPAAIEGVAALFERVPLELGDTQVLAAPLFHAWGLTHLMLGLARSTTTVLARRFDAEAALAATSQHEAQVLVVVPVMLHRIVALPPELLVRWPTPNLRVIASSGSALGSRLTTEVLDRFGPVLYNLYGSTEVAVATIATPDDLRRAPATAGRVAFGVRVEVLDERGAPVADGTVGRVFVGGSMRFEGYTNGGGKEEQHGLLSSGDLGRFEDGLLFVEGREDDMIVSGGENVYPGEVEELLSHHPEIDEVAVVGVADSEFGQVLAAAVVCRRGASLDGDQVRAHVRRHLARHKVPKHVQLVDELPRNVTGKVLRRTIVESFRVVTAQMQMMVALEPFARTSGGAATLRVGIRYEGAVRQQQRRLATVGAIVTGGRTTAQRWSEAEHAARRQLAPSRRATGGRAPAVHWHGPDTVLGTGRPVVVLVNGWTASGLLWPATLIERLESQAEVVRVDNRGSGWSRTAPSPFTIADLADDVVDVLDAIGAASATVVGLSMGGMIAQEMALRHPARVDHLVLCGTRPPAPAGFAPSPTAITEVMTAPRPGEHVRDVVARGWSAVTAPGFDQRHPAIIDELVERVLARPTPRAAVIAQLRAISSWHGSSRLAAIAVPTTVLHGAVDPLIPVGNGMRLAQLVPGATYVELAAVGHLVAHEAENALVNAVSRAVVSW